MKLGVENKKQMAILAVVGSLAIGSLVYVYSSLSGGGAPAPAAPPVVTTKPAAPAAKSTKASGGVAANVGTTAAQLDPTLKMGRMLATEALVYTGTGRNIFSPASMPIAIPKPVASVRPKALPPPP